MASLDYAHPMPVSLIQPVHMPRRLCLLDDLPTNQPTTRHVGQQAMQSAADSSMNQHTTPWEAGDIPHHHPN